ncbi:MAG: MarR family transcriptional regulator, partial [Nitrosotalea sp.]
ITDGLTQKELADKIYVDGSTLVPVIDKMEKNGLVERRADPKDRRMNRVFLTKKSESTVDSIILIVLQLRKMLFRGISADQLDSTKKILATMIQNSDAMINELKSSGQDTT